MAMSGGNPGSGLSNEINVTPMIDVLLVLLIIFMMVIPMSRKAIDLQFERPTRLKPYPLPESASRRPKEGQVRVPRVTVRNSSRAEQY